MSELSVEWAQPNEGRGTLVKLDGKIYIRTVRLTHGANEVSILELEIFAINLGNDTFRLTQR